MPVEECLLTFLSLEDRSANGRGLRNLNAQRRENLDTPGRNQVERKGRKSIAHSSEFKMQEFLEEIPVSEFVQEQCFAPKGLESFQSDTECVGFNNGRENQRVQRKERPRDVAVNAMRGSCYQNNQPYTQNEKPDLSERQIEGAGSSKEHNFDSPPVLGEPLERVVFRRPCAWAEELTCLSRMLKFMCKNAMSLQPKTHSELMMFAEKCPVHARGCYQLAQLIFFLSAFSSQMMSVLENMMKTLTVLNATDFEPKQLVSAVRKVASVFPLLDMEVQDMCSKYVRRASSDEKTEKSTEPKLAEQTGTLWQLFAASNQLDIACENLEMASQLMKKVPQRDYWCCLGVSQCPIHSQTYFQRACREEKCMILALKFRTIEEKVSLLMRAVKLSKHRQ